MYIYLFFLFELRLIYYTQEYFNYISPLATSIMVHTGENPAQLHGTTVS